MAVVVVGSCFFSMCLFLLLFTCVGHFSNIVMHISLHFNTRCVICQVSECTQFFSFFFLFFFKPVPVFYFFLSRRKCADICRNRRLQSSSCFAGFLHTHKKKHAPVCKTIRTRALTFLFNLKRNKTHGEHYKKQFIFVYFLCYRLQKKKNRWRLFFSLFHIINICAVAWRACIRIWYLLTDITHLLCDLYDMMQHWHHCKVLKIMLFVTFIYFSFHFTCVWMKANHLNMITKLLIYWNIYLESQSLARIPLLFWCSSLFRMCVYTFCGMRYDSLKCVLALYRWPEYYLNKRNTKRKHNSYVHWLLSWVFNSSFLCI